MLQVIKENRQVLSGSAVFWSSVDHIYYWSLLINFLSDFHTRDDLGLYNLSQNMDFWVF